MRSRARGRGRGHRTRAEHLSIGHDVDAHGAAATNKALEVDVKLADEKPGAVVKATPKSQAEETKAKEKKSVESQVESDPLIMAAQNVFKAQIKSIKEN